MTELEKLNPILQVVKLDGKSITDTINNGILNGDVDPLQVHLALKKLETVINSTIGAKGKKEVKDAILKEASNRVEKGSTFSYLGAEVTVCDTYSYTDYSGCNDIYYNELRAIEKKVKVLIKTREKLLDSLPKPSGVNLAVKPTVIVQDTIPNFELLDYGEELSLFAPVKKGREGIKVSFKKNK